MTRTRLIVGSIAFVAIVGVSLYAFHVVEQFLIRDDRFTVAPPDAAPNHGLRITGVSHASMRAVENVFNEDVGRSLYLVPMKDRLESVRNVAWVRDASIARVWPNRLVIHVEERTPVAFVTLPSGKFALMDADGVILPPAKDHFMLPVITGLKANATQETRKDAVDHMLRLSTDLGEAMKEVSEVDVSSPGNISISRAYEGRSLKLMLGDRNYRTRYQHFLNHFREIETQVPGARVIDLRLDDRITVVEAER
jgi:cell division protein FtsQ